MARRRRHRPAQRRRHRRAPAHVAARSRRGRRLRRLVVAPLADPAAGRALGHRAQRPRGRRRDAPGEEAVYDPVPYFWSEQFGHMLQYAGHHPAGDRLVHRGEPEGKWSAVWLAGDGTLAAVLAVDRPRDLVQGRRIIDAGSRLDPERLVDPQVPLRDCVV
ncbi:oxidoreductase C-terminal domain-containing protein [Nonomuraea thailandensis]